MTLIWLRLFAVPLTKVTDHTIQSANNIKLFGLFNKPFINDVGQGFLGNCYFLATLGSFAYKKPE